MTTRTMMQACPVCEYRYTLEAGRLPQHLLRGDPCPGGGLDPDAAARIADDYFRDWVVSGLSLPSLREGRGEASGPLPALDDAPASKKRKPRSDRGTRPASASTARAALGYETGLAVPVLAPPDASAKAEAARIQDAVDKAKGDVLRLQQRTSAVIIRRLILSPKPAWRDLREASRPRPVCIYAGCEAPATYKGTYPLPTMTGPSEGTLRACGPHRDAWPNLLWEALAP